MASRSYSHMQNTHNGGCFSHSALFKSKIALCDEVEYTESDCKLPEEKIPSTLEELFRQTRSFENWFSLDLYLYTWFFLIIF